MDFFSYNSEERIGKDNDLVKMRDLIQWERFTVLIKGLSVVFFSLCISYYCSNSLCIFEV